MSDLVPTKTPLLERGLPKWPQMYTTGLPVKPEQANEIIRRTDYFLYSGHGGNDHRWNEWAIDLLKMPHGWKISETRQPGKKIDWQKRWEIEEAWKKEWGIIQTSYVHNSWLSCAFIGGPHGWCHPDGQIGFVDNIGKWPDVETVLADWTALAEEFPFVSAGVTLWNCESCERRPDWEPDNFSSCPASGPAPVVSMRVFKGKVELADPELVNVHADHPEATRAPGNRGDNFEADVLCIGGPAALREHGVPRSWLEEWAKRLK